MTNSASSTIKINFNKSKIDTAPVSIREIFHFSPVCTYRVEYEALWGNSCRSESVMTVHVFHNPIEDLWFATTSPEWLGIEWAEAVARDMKTAVELAVTDKANSNRREHSIQEGPWVGIYGSPEYQGIEGCWFSGISDITPAAEVASRLLDEGGPQRASNAGAAIIAALPGWRFPKARRNNDDKEYRYCSCCGELIWEGDWHYISQNPKGSDVAIDQAISDHERECPRAWDSWEKDVLSILPPCATKEWTDQNVESLIKYTLEKGFNHYWRDLPNPPDMLEHPQWVWVTVYNVIGPDAANKIRRRFEDYLRKIHPIDMLELAFGHVSFK